MSQSRYSLFVSLVLLLSLTVGFFFAARLASSALKSSVDKAIATATVVVLPPTPTRVRPTGTPAAGHAGPAAPTPSATPQQSNNLVVSASSNASDAQTSFPTSTEKFWCVTNFSHVPPNAQLVYQFQHLLPNSVAPVYTSIAYTYPSVLAAYMYGPQPAGQYRCQVLINGQLAATAPFTVK